MLTREEIALRIMEAQLQSGKPLGDISVREAFAVALTFEDHAKVIRAAKQNEPKKLAYDDNGL